VLPCHPATVQPSNRPTVQPSNRPRFAERTRPDVGLGKAVMSLVIAVRPLFYRHVGADNACPLAYDWPRLVGCRNGVLAMCDYSLHGVRNRPAKVGEKLVTTDFGTGTRGFASPDDLKTAVCLLPGTELAFSSEVSYSGWTISSLIKERLTRTKTPHRTAIFRQINLGMVTHHDALEFPDGEVVLLTRLSVGQDATVLQLPAGRYVAAETQKREPAALVK
jgi:hypothetical protein